MPDPSKRRPVRRPDDQAASDNKLGSFYQGATMIDEREAVEKLIAKLGEQPAEIDGDGDADCDHEPLLAQAVVEAEAIREAFNELAVAHGWPPLKPFIYSADWLRLHPAGLPAADIAHAAAWQRLM